MNILLAIRRKYDSEFDSLHCVDLEVTARLFGNVRSLLWEIVNRVNWAQIRPNLSDAMQQANYAVEFLTSALVLAKQRARAEAFVLLRSTIEQGATALAIAIDGSAYAEYAEGALKLSQVLALAKRRLPLVGRFYGQLSAEVVHPNRRAYGASTHFGERGEPLMRVSIGPERSADPDRDRLTLIAVNFGAVFLHWILGQIFFEDTVLLGTRRLRHTDHAFSGFPSSSQVEEVYDQFDAIVRPPDARRNGQGPGASSGTQA